MPAIPYNISDYYYKYALLSVSDLGIFSAERKIRAENTMRFSFILEEATVTHQSKQLLLPSCCEQMFTCLCMLHSSH